MKTKEKQMDEALDEYVKTINQEYKKYKNADKTAFKKYEEKNKEIEKKFETKSTDIELKTLKDLEYDSETIGEIIQKDKVKQEAIKWVKAFRIEEKKNPELKLCWDTARNTFENFHNITESDLEDKK